VTDPHDPAAPTAPHLCDLPSPHNVLVGIEVMCRAHCGRSWWRTESKPTGWMTAAEAAEAAATDAVSALVLRPDDRVLIGMASVGLTREDVHAMQDQLRARFPDVEFTIVAGVTGMAVQRAVR
jgi:hypothetical protein